MLCFAPWKKALAAAACLSGALFAAPGAFGSTGERAAAEAGAAESVLVAAEGEWPAWLVEAVKRLKTDGQGDGAQLLHVLVEVSVEDAHEERLEAVWLEARQSLDEKRDQIGPFQREAQGEDRLVIRLDDAAAVGIAAEALRDAGEGDVEVSAEGPMLTAALTEAARAGMDERAMGRSVEILKRRLDQAGTREATIQRQGERRIAIEAPANGSAEELLALIGTNAKLSFHLVESAAADATARPGPDRIRIEDAEEPGRFYLVERRPLITGERLVDAHSGFNQQTSEPVVDFRFDQRVALARALARQPRVLLADEPTGHLDPDASEEFAELLRDLCLRGLGVVTATHDRRLAQHADRTLWLREPVTVNP